MKRQRFLRGLGIGLLVLLFLLLVSPFLVPVPPLEGTVPPEALADPDSRFVEINGLNVHYKMRGAGEPVFVLLHGSAPASTPGMPSSTRSANSARSSPLTGRPSASPSAH